MHILLIVQYVIIYCTNFAIILQVLVTLLLSNLMMDCIILLISLVVLLFQRHMRDESVVSAMSWC